MILQKTVSCQANKKTAKQIRQTNINNQLESIPKDKAFYILFEEDESVQYLMFDLLQCGIKFPAIRFSMRNVIAPCHYNSLYRASARLAQLKLISRTRRLRRRAFTYQLSPVFSDANFVNEVMCFLGSKFADFTAEKFAEKQDLDGDTNCDTHSDTDCDTNSDTIPFNLLTNKFKKPFNSITHEKDAREGNEQRRTLQEQVTQQQRSGMLATPKEQHPSRSFPVYNGQTAAQPPHDVQKTQGRPPTPPGENPIKRQIATVFLSELHPDRLDVLDFVKLSSKGYYLTLEARCFLAQYPRHILESARRQLECEPYGIKNPWLVFLDHCNSGGNWCKNINIANDLLRVIEAPQCWTPYVNGDVFRWRVFPTRKATRLVSGLRDNVARWKEMQYANGMTA